MKHSDLAALLKGAAPAFRDYVAEAVKPLLLENEGLRHRIDALEKRPIPERGEPGPPGKDGEKGADGKDGDPGKDGRDGIDGKDGEAGKDGTDGRDGNDGEKGADGNDGAGIADLVVDRDGSLVASFTDGRMKNLGKIVGRDGADGKDGADGLTMTLDDFDIVPTDERTIEVSFTQGDKKHTYELEFPVPVYRGVWKDGETYSRGDVCTWGGSLWHCDKAGATKPDTGDWRLMVKKGRDGKDATK